MADRETELMIREALAALPEAQRVPIVLIYLEGYSVEATAQMLGIAVGTVKSRAARGRMRLRKLLEHLRVPIKSPHPIQEETTDRSRNDGARPRATPMLVIVRGLPSSSSMNSRRSSAGTVATGVGSTNHAANGLSVLYHLLWLRELAVELRPEPVVSR